ncbi:sigma-70 family RNA polymerase sigma factor [Brevibacillus sp. NRS-1366]|uniref:sigma-70 family RNA polymerase sigma factor n=1 Tax=Brevibacillus sp. NRS-1366 TaxID=3233899 RepID=UPI003D257F26
MQNKSLKEAYMLQLRRIAWRIQYEVKKQNHFVQYLGQPIEFLHCDYNQASFDLNLYIEEILSNLTDTGRFIIQRLVLEGATESDVAKQLNVSQQWVNACKRKYLNQLRKSLSTSQKGA